MGSRCIFPIKVLIEIINFWALELAAKIASKLTNYFFVKLIILYNAQLNVSHIQKLYQNNILWYFL
jgi:predicted nuclease of restriction endonuclease-like RecB superfamily